MVALNDAAFQVLCDWLDAEPADVHPDGVRYSGQAEVYRHLLDVGALTLGAGVVPTISCPSCGDIDLVSLGFSKPGYRGYCADCGWLDLLPHEVRPLHLEASRIARWLQAAMGLSGQYPLLPLLPEVLWRLGELEHRRTRYSVFFARRGYNSDFIETVNQHLAEHSAPGRGLLVSASGVIDAAMSSRPLLIPLRAVAHLRKGGLQVENLEQFLDSVKPTLTEIPETSLRLLRSGRIALVAGESIKVPPQAQHFLLCLLQAQGQPVTKRKLADWLEISVDDCSGSKVFKRCKSIYQTFVGHDQEGRYWLKSAYILPADQF